MFADLWRVVFSFERSFSRFIPKSELTQLNRLAGLRFEITTEFENLLRTAKGLSQQTGGLYNPFILPALQQAGYRRSAVPGYENDAVDDYSRRRMATTCRSSIAAAGRMAISRRRSACRRSMAWAARVPAPMRPSSTSCGRTWRRGVRRCARCWKASTDEAARRASFGRRPGGCPRPRRHPARPRDAMAGPASRRHRDVIARGSIIQPNG